MRVSCWHVNQCPRFPDGQLKDPGKHWLQHKRKSTGCEEAIKFGDENMDLMLDVRVNDEWRRNTPSEARSAARENPDIRVGPKRLQGGDIVQLIGKKKQTRTRTTYPRLSSSQHPAPAAPGASNGQPGAWPSAGSGTTGRNAPGSSSQD